MHCIIYQHMHLMYNLHYSLLRNVRMAFKKNSPKNNLAIIIPKNLAVHTGT